MIQPSTQELARIAASIRLTGELLEANGTRAIHATTSWSRGPRSANLDPDTGGWRYDTFTAPNGDLDTYAVPNDTTGEAAMAGDRLGDTSEKLVRLIAEVDEKTAELRNLLYAACPQDTMPTSFEPDTPAQISAAGWCVSCHRDSGYCEPVSMRPDGGRRYRDYCTWCGEWVANEKKRCLQEPKKKGKRKKGGDRPDPMPPLELVEARHRGDRITQQMVDRALARKAS